MSMKEALAEMVGNLKEWQQIERTGIAQTAEIQKQTDNQIIALVLDIIQRDSSYHHRVQQLIIDSLEQATLSLTPEELGKVWEGIEKHIALERRTIELAKASLGALGKGQGRGYVVQQYLLSYLLADEEKHNKMLDDLDTIKKGMYPYG